ncbi:uncharacterized protein LOC141610879 isoform X2 [Silene latifolia]|uniref:uncharacterized protein LOC141610879 isoform X2 n=1 Tax=Silene latifolia TaxID=37657 RepID=UPI003D7819E6
MTTNRKKRRLTKTTASTPPTSTSKNFTNQTDELAFKQRHYDLNTTRVYHLRPPKSLSSTARPWIATRETTADYNFIFRHPLTSKPHSFNLPPDFYFPQLNSAILAVFYAFRKSNSVDKLLVLPAPCYDSVSKCNLFVLYGGGQLKGRHGTSPWVKLSHRNSPWVKFDDIIDLKDKTYVVDRWGIINLVNHYKTVNTISIGKTLISEPVIPGSGQFGWRKRFAVDGEVLFLVVRMEEKLFKVFRLKSEKRGGTTCFNWVRVWEFGGNKVLFMARDCYFFRRASRKFPGREYRNCIVFSEAAFPQYGKDGWEFIESGNVRRCEDDIAVFCLGDERFAREGEEEGEGEKSGFPKIDWSPPDWILNVSSFTEDEFSMHSESESSVQSERVPDEDEGPDSDSGEKNDGEVQSGVMDSKTKDDEEQEVMEYDFVSQDQDQGGVECDSDSQDQEDEKMQCDLNSQEKDNEEMHSKEANAEHDNVSLQEDPVTPSRSAVEEEVTRTLLRMNSENDAMEEETSGKNITYVIPQASTSATTEEILVIIHIIVRPTMTNEDSLYEMEGVYLY